MRSHHLLARPEQREQWGNDFLVVWAAEPRGDRRRGWVIVPEEHCDRSRCGCHLVDVDVHEVDDRLVAIADDAESLAFSWRGPEPDDVATYEASIDLWSGRVAKPFTHEPGRPTALENGSAEELTAAMPGAALEQLWERLESSKGRRVGRLANKPPRGWEPGDLVVWRKIARYERPDLYELESGRVVMDTLFCPMPACHCNEAIVQIAGYDVQGLDDEAGRGPSGRVYVRFDGSPPRIEAGKGHDEARVLTAWRAYCERWPEWERRLEDRYLRGRAALAATVATPIAEPDSLMALSPDEYAASGLAAELRGPGQARPAGRVGKVPRKSPCPCGSGKKYKRCCWPRWEGA